MTKALRFFNIILLCAIALPLLVHAQEQDKNLEQEQKPAPKIKLEDYTNEYSPEYCDFIASFPESPMVIKQCEKQDDPSTCYNLVSYTKVFGLSSTVKVEVICNPVTPEMYEHFTPKVMEDTVRTMTKDKVSKEFNVDSKEEEFYRQAGIVGQGRKGVHDTLYIAQLWTTQNSIMSVEAELMGEQTPEADLLFANILRNIGHINDFKGKEYGIQKMKAWEDKKATFLDAQKKSNDKAENNTENKDVAPKMSAP